jgi:hypothetical protein
VVLEQRQASPSQAPCRTFSPTSQSTGELQIESIGQRQIEPIGQPQNNNIITTTSPPLNNGTILYAVIDQGGNIIVRDQVGEILQSSDNAATIPYIQCGENTPQDRPFTDNRGTILTGTRRDNESYTSQTDDGPVIKWQGTSAWEEILPVATQASLQVQSSLNGEGINEFPLKDEGANPMWSLSPNSITSSQAQGRKSTTPLQSATNQGTLSNEDLEDVLKLIGTDPMMLAESVDISQFEDIVQDGCAPRTELLNTIMKEPVTKRRRNQGLLDTIVNEDVSSEEVANEEEQKGLHCGLIDKILLKHPTMTVLLFVLLYLLLVLFIDDSKLGYWWKVGISVLVAFVVPHRIYRKEQ